MTIDKASHNVQVEGSKKSSGTIFQEQSEPKAAYRDVDCSPSRPTINFLLIHPLTEILTLGPIDYKSEGRLIHQVDSD